MTRIILLRAFLLFSLSNSGICFTQNIDNFKRIQDAFNNSRSTQVLIAAHRGVHNFYPENSLASIKQSIIIGADIVEIDIRLSRDGVPVLMHDKSVKRTTNGKGNVEDLTLDELKSLNLVTQNGVSTSQIPTLEEALTLTKGNIMVDLDLQAADSGAISFLSLTLRRAFPRNVEPILDVIRKTGTEKEVILFDRNYRILEIIHTQDSQLVLMPRVYSALQTTWIVQLFHSPIIHISPDFCIPSVTGLAKKHGKRLWLNTLGDIDQQLLKNETSSELQEMIKNGANVIQTNEPEMMLVFLQKQSLHW